LGRKSEHKNEGVQRFRKIKEGAGGQGESEGNPRAFEKNINTILFKYGKKEGDPVQRKKGDVGVLADTRGFILKKIICKKVLSYAKLRGCWG